MGDRECEELSPPSATDTHSFIYCAHRNYGLLSLLPFKLRIFILSWVLEQSNWITESDSDSDEVTQKHGRRKRTNNRL